MQERLKVSYLLALALVENDGFVVTSHYKVLHHAEQQALLLKFRRGRSF